MLSALHFLAPIFLPLIFSTPQSVIHGPSLQVFGIVFPMLCSTLLEVNVKPLHLNYRNPIRPIFASIKSKGNKGSARNEFDMSKVSEPIQSPAHAISASPRLRGIETRLTRIKKNPGLAERSNAEKWVPNLSALDFSALTEFTVMTKRGNTHRVGTDWTVP